MLKEVLRRLPKLTKAELAQVKVRATFLLGDASTEIATSQDWLLDGVTLELRRRGLWPHSSALPKRFLPSNYAETASHVREHLLKGVGAAKLRPHEGMALGSVAAAALADYLVRGRIPVTSKTLLLNLDKIPVALEAAFPGYWAAALLGFCFKDHKWPLKKP